MKTLIFEPARCLNIRSCDLIINLAPAPHEQTPLSRESRPNSGGQMHGATATLALLDVGWLRSLRRPDAIWGTTCRTLRS